MNVACIFLCNIGLLLPERIWTVKLCVCVSKSDPITDPIKMKIRSERDARNCCDSSQIVIVSITIPNNIIE